MKQEYIEVKWNGRMVIRLNGNLALQIKLKTSVLTEKKNWIWIPKFEKLSFQLQYHFAIMKAA